MKALTLTQPFASLIAIGAKKIETRSWRTSYRGPLAIHAAKGFPEDARRLVRDDWTFFGALNPEYAEYAKTAGLKLVPSEVGRRTEGQLPVGAVIATCQLVACIQAETIMETLGERERAFGNYGPGRFAWILEDIQPLPEPIPAKGALSLWEWHK